MVFIMIIVLCVCMCLLKMIEIWFWQSHKRQSEITIIIWGTRQSDCGICAEKTHFTILIAATGVLRCQSEYPLLSVSFLYQFWGLYLQFKTQCLFYHNSLGTNPRSFEWKKKYRKKGRRERIGKGGKKEGKKGREKGRKKKKEGWKGKLLKPKKDEIKKNNEKGKEGKIGKKDTEW